MSETRPQPYAVLRRHGVTLQFFLGDCIDCLPRLAAGSIDATVTSPPYNLGIKYQTFDDTMPRADYLRLDRPLGRRVARVLAPAGSLFLNVGAKPKDPWVAIDVAQAVRPTSSCRTPSTG